MSARAPSSFASEDAPPCFAERLVRAPATLYDARGARIGFANPGKLVRVLRRGAWFEGATFEPPAPIEQGQGGGWIEVDLDHPHMTARMEGALVGARVSMPKGTGWGPIVVLDRGDGIESTTPRDRPPFQSAPISCDRFMRPLADDPRIERANDSVVAGPKDLGQPEAELGVPGPGFMAGAEVPMRAFPGGPAFGSISGATPFRVLERYGDAVHIVARWPKARSEEALLVTEGWVPLEALSKEPDLAPMAPVVEGRLVAQTLDDWALSHFKVYVPSFRAEPHFEGDVAEDGTFRVQAGLPDATHKGATVVSVEARSVGGGWAGAVDNVRALPGGGGDALILVARTASISGVVKTPGGALVPGAAIAMDGGDGRAESWVDGSFQMRALPGRRHRLTASTAASVGAALESASLLAAAPAQGIVLRTLLPRPVFGAVPRDQLGRCAASAVTFSPEPPRGASRDGVSPAHREEITVPVGLNCRFTLDELPSENGVPVSYGVRTVGASSLVLQIDAPQMPNGQLRPVCFEEGCAAGDQGSVQFSIVDERHVLLQPPVTVNVTAGGAHLGSCQTGHGQCFVHNLDPGQPVEIELSQGDRVLSRSTVSPVVGVKEVVVPVVLVPGTQLAASVE